MLTFRESDLRQIILQTYPSVTCDPYQAHFGSLTVLSQTGIKGRTRIQLQALAALDLVLMWSILIHHLIENDTPSISAKHLVQPIAKLCYNITHP